MNPLISTPSPVLSKGGSAALLLRKSEKWRALNQQVPLVNARKCIQQFGWLQRQKRREQYNRNRSGRQHSVSQRERKRFYTKPRRRGDEWTAGKDVAAAVRVFVCLALVQLDHNAKWKERTCPSVESTELIAPGSEKRAAAAAAAQACPSNCSRTRVACAHRAHITRRLAPVYPTPLFFGHSSSAPPSALVGPSPCPPPGVIPISSGYSSPRYFSALPRNSLPVSPDTSPAALLTNHVNDNIRIFHFACLAPLSGSIRLRLRLGK